MKDGSMFEELDLSENLIGSDGLKTRSKSMYSAIANKRPLRLQTLRIDGSGIKGINTVETCLASLRKPHPTIQSPLLYLPFPRSDSELCLASVRPMLKAAVANFLEKLEIRHNEEMSVLRSRTIPFQPPVSVLHETESSLVVARRTVERTALVENKFQYSCVTEIYKVLYTFQDTVNEAFVSLNTKNIDVQPLDFCSTPQMSGLIFVDSEYEPFVLENTETSKTEKSDDENDDFEFYTNSLIENLKKRGMRKSVPSKHKKSTQMVQNQSPEPAKPKKFKTTFIKPNETISGSDEESRPRKKRKIKSDSDEENDSPPIRKRKIKSDSDEDSPPIRTRKIKSESDEENVPKQKRKNESDTPEAKAPRHIKSKSRISDSDEGENQKPIQKKKTKKSHSYSEEVEEPQPIKHRNSK
jgi:hypothetical protein